MAILGDFEVTIHSNGTQRIEYDDDDAPSTAAAEHNVPPEFGSITKYVEVVSGEEFEFHLATSPSYRFRSGNLLVWRVFIDGDYSGSKTTRLRGFRRRIGETRFFKAVYASENGFPVRKLLRFSDVETSKCCLV